MALTAASRCVPAFGSGDALLSGTGCCIFCAGDAAGLDVVDDWLLVGFDAAGGGLAVVAAGSFFDLPNLVSYLSMKLLVISPIY